MSSYFFEFIYFGLFTWFYTGRKNFKNFQKPFKVMLDSMHACMNALL